MRLRDPDIEGERLQEPDTEGERLQEQMATTRGSRRIRTRMRRGLREGPQG